MLDILIFGTPGAIVLCFLISLSAGERDRVATRRVLDATRPVQTHVGLSVGDRVQWTKTGILGTVTGIQVGEDYPTMITTATDGYGDNGCWSKATEYIRINTNV